MSVHPLQLWGCGEAAGRARCSFTANLLELVLAALLLLLLLV
jgi:hypothetical protein